VKRGLPTDSLALLREHGRGRSAGRWHTPARGKRIVYLAEHPAVALIEVLANLESDPALLTETFQLIRAETLESVSVSALDPDALPPDRRDNFSLTRSIGDEWLRSGGSALLAVPSAASPESLNYLLNPLHADATGVGIAWRQQLNYDRRLFHIR